MISSRETMARSLTECDAFRRRVDISSVTSPQYGYGVFSPGPNRLPRRSGGSLRGRSRSGNALLRCGGTRLALCVFGGGIGKIDVKGTIDGLGTPGRLG